jgi:hypothetical protein
LFFISSTSEASANTPPTSQPYELFLGEEEIFDSSLSTFYTFDREAAAAAVVAAVVAGFAGHGHYH